MSTVHSIGPDSCLDLGQGVERRKQTPWTEPDSDAMHAEARTRIEKEAEHPNYWLGLFDDVVLDMDLTKIATELHKAWMGGTVRHCLRDVALDHVERATAEELKEMCRDVD